MPSTFLDNQVAHYPLCLKLTVAMCSGDPAPLLTGVIMFVMAEFELGIGVCPFIPGEWRQLDPDRLFA